MLIGGTGITTPVQQICVLNYGLIPLSKCVLGEKEKKGHQHKVQPTEAVVVLSGLHVCFYNIVTQQLILLPVYTLQCRNPNVELKQTNSVQQGPLPDLTNLRNSYTPSAGHALLDHLLENHCLNTGTTTIQPLAPQG